MTVILSMNQMLPDSCHQVRWQLEDSGSAHPHIFPVNKHCQNLAYYLLICFLTFLLSTSFCLHILRMVINVTEYLVVPFHMVVVITTIATLIGFGHI